MNKKAEFDTQKEIENMNIYDMPVSEMVQKLPEIMVYCPHSKKEVNIAPFLWGVSFYFNNFKSAAENFTLVIEDLITHCRDMMDEDANSFSSHMYSLVMMRRILSWIHKGKVDTLEM